MVTQAASPLKRLKTINKSTEKGLQRRKMGVFTDHPHTAITERINSIIRDEELDPEIEIPELLGLITLQYSGPTEAARAMRKKLKYGNSMEQGRSLELLNLVVVNGGPKLAELYNDRKLLELLRFMANDPTVNMQLRKGIIGYAIVWNEEFQGKREYTGVVNLKSQLPKARRVRKKRRDDFMDDEALSDDNDSYNDERSTASSSSSSNRHHQQQQHQRQQVTRTTSPNDKYRIPKINLTKEGPKIKALIAEASKCSTDLNNALQSINRSRGQLSSDDPRCCQLFDKTRIVRRRILRYLQLVESEEFLGSLIHSNEELVAALQKYSEYASVPGQDSTDDYESVSDDDDDDDDDDDVRSETISVSESLASRMIEQHARSKISAGNDPFSDINRVDETAGWR